MSREALITRSRRSWCASSSLRKWLNIGIYGEEEAESIGEDFGLDCAGIVPASLDGEAVRIRFDGEEVISVQLGRWFKQDWWTAVGKKIYKTTWILKSVLPLQPFHNPEYQ